MLSIDRVLDKEHFYGKTMQKMCAKKLVLDHFLVLVNNPKHNSHCMQESLLKIRYFERGLSNGL